NQPINGRTFFFTDRSLYRPGQTVYFKGLVVTNKNEKNDVAANFSTTIFLRNANHELVDSLKMTTNSFGSFNGTFSLPQNVLNGHFTITDKESHYQTSFSVEEYKRPKFFVSFDKIKGTYKAGDTINLTGSAKAYAGNTIDNAKVVYRVVRQARFIYPWNHWRIWPPQGEPMEIAHGTTTTNKDGSFTIQFVAHPDKKLDRRLDPVFDYKIHVDVTDIGGETRTGDNIVSAGYKSLLLKVTVPERISKDSLRSLSIRTENMNGEFQTAGVRVSFYSLVPEPRLVRKRYWQQPDQYLITKEEFLSNFPTDEYRNESEYRNWERGAMVYSKTDTTNSSAAFTINNSNMQPGFYSIEIETKDKEGAVIKDTRFIEVFDNNSNQPAAPIYLWAKGSQPIEPGERTAIQIGSSTKIYLVKQVDKSKRNNSRYISQRDKHDFEFSEINQEKKSFTFNATEIDRGGYGVTFFFVRDNRFYQFQDVVRVPWTNKELNIEYATFRDKTLPGSEEKWKVKINGYKNEKVAAEMLASMYDASLDQFKPHQWNKPMIWLTYGRPVQWQGMQNFSAVQSQIKYSGKERYRTFEKRYDRFMFDNLHRDGYGGDMMMRREMVTAAAPELQEIVVVEDAFKIAEAVTKEEMISKDQTSTESITNKPDPSQLDVRRNFNETAFFFPELLTDKNGNIEFSFTTPEALTRWKLQTFAHTKDLAFGFAQKEIITQKELMVQPNMPRFLRQGDQVTLSSKIANLSEHALTGTATLQLFDATTNAPVDAAFGNTTATRSFTAINGESTVVTFPIKVPVDFTGVLTWRIVASAASKTPDINSWSDGEEMTIPVLSNKLLVTETMPLPMRGSGTKSFAFDKLLKGSNSTTLQHHALTVEYTSNPAWYAVQALPYLMEQSIESAEQIWNRYYANSLAVKIISSAPRIKQIFEQWKTLDTSALLSNLQKNQELTNALLEETPWVLQAKTEEQQKKNIALLFDLVRMSNEIQNAFRKLKDFQSSNGGFVWVKGAPDDRYMTQYIITGIGHLKQLNAINADQQDEMNAILKAAIPYLDRKIAEDYAHLIKSKASLVHYTPGYLQVQYLYMRSFFPEVSIGSVYKTAHNFYQARAHRTWMKQNKYMQGMIALALHRNKDLQTPADIIKSLKETAINSEEMGMYWQDQRFGYSWNWWHAPIETQALLVEAFTEISADTKAVDDMRTWLIKHKQTNNWRTSKATAEAVYAFLLQGTEWLSDEPVVQIELGSTIVKSTDRKTEAGTGYFKHTFDKEAVKPAMGNIKITVNPANNQGTLNSTSWGAVYWQYFEDMDKITNASTPLQLNKKLFVQTNSDRGPVLTPVTTNSLLQVGDKITVRVEVTVDRDMEYVHMKDMRASAFEPVNVLSGYKWQGGLGYYETTKDVSTSFFFPSLRRGTYVFEYSLFVTHTGSYSNGITTIQSMYAPEFSAHSEGVRVRVGE
ncbi:MAG TPA: alpha-2-macroglobulin family protein, partial [Flavisolibacter sp.]|nr:alpha-2-macroglobulin family protein [Flavisolibacter sp.]